MTVVHRVTRRAGTRLLPSLYAILLLTSLPTFADTRFYETVQPVLESRCIACHACFSSPCQLNLSHPDGWRRGASKDRVYDGARIKDDPPSRLFEDAHSVEAWREMGFFTVTEPVSDGNQSQSIMKHFMDWHAQVYGPLSAQPDASQHEGQIGLRGPTDDWSCPSDSLETTRLKRGGKVGMPYDLSALDPRESETLLRWMADGFPGPDAQEEAARFGLSEASRKLLRQWEDYLNADDPRQRLLSRYLYEHLFLSRLVFPEQPERSFRLVRSASAAPAPIEEVATRRPYDDPGQAIYYRLRVDRATRTHKAHVVFDAGPEALARIQSLFDLAAWPEKEPGFPAYPEDGVFNAFTTYAAIPVRARYQFFLDNARYFVMSFIRGPVCEGQVAVNVINDYFWTAFVEPDKDLSVTDPAFLERAGQWLGVPPKSRSGVLDLFRTTLRDSQQKYARFREQAYRNQYPKGMTLDSFWQGANGNQEGPDRDRALTIVRHHDTASVLWGWQGVQPQAVWVLDYPIFERIYYLLVAGFDVYGSITHQASTRLYMDKLRIESQQNWFDFLAPEEKVRVRAQLNRGEGVLEELNESHPLYNPQWKPAIAPAISGSQIRLLQAVRDQLGLPAAQSVGSSLPSSMKPLPALPDSALSSLHRLAEGPAELAQNFPDYSILLLTDDRGEEHVVSLVRNRSHLNVNELFKERERYEPGADTLLPVHGLVGSYPNLIFKLNVAQLPLWLQAMRGSDVPGFFEAESYTRSETPVRLPFAIDRLHPDFWRVYDRVQHYVDTHYPVYAGRLDISKYTYQLNTDSIRNSPESRLNPLVKVDVSP